MAKKYSMFPSAASISLGDSVVGLRDGANTRFSFATILSAIQSLFVPTSRKVNNKALSSDITLDASDVGAVDTADVGVADGVASLDSTGKVPPSQLPPISSDAEDITYDPTTSGESATNVQDALDEAFGDLDGKQDTITASGILKGDGQGGVSAAAAGTDYGTYSKPSGGIPASDLANGVIPTVPSAYTSNPAMDGTASPGSSGEWAKGDHVHPSDTSKANQSQLAYVETSTTASRAYAVGEYFCLNGLLYRVTTAISSGGSFTPGTNCEQVTEGGFNNILASPIFTGNCNDLPVGFAYAYSSATNIPEAGGSFFIITMRYSTHGAQIAIRRDGNAAYYRRCSSGSWASSWVSM